MYSLIRNTLILLCALLPLAVQAVTLGEARVKSFLNQPLDVEIDLVGLTAGQNEQLRLRLANQEHFDRLGIAYTRLLEDLEFDIVREGNRWLVRARSDRPINEPFIDFPLLMTWPGGQMVRQYTLLLDPQRPIRPARASQTSRTSRPVSAPPATAPATSPAADTYGPVRRGETLWPIAQQLKPAGITTRQMAMALLRANPKAFIDNNVNKLRAGAVLTIPSVAFIEEVDPQTARAKFAAQTQRRQPAVATSPRSLPAAPAQPAPEPEPPVQEPAEQTAQAAVEPPEETGESNPQLRIVNEEVEQTDSETASEKDLQEKLLVTMEEIESNRLTTDAIESRLARLEAEIDRMQQLVELKDAQIAALQSEVQTRNELEAAAQAAEPPPPALAIAESDTPSTIDVEPVAAPTPAVTIEAATPAAAPTAATKAWQEQYLWMLWVVIAILGLTILALLLRRPQQVVAGPAAAELPAMAASAAAAPAAPEPAPEASDMRSAEQDFRALADARLPASVQGDTDGAELPDVGRESRADINRNDDNEELTDSVLAEMLEESRLAPETPAASSKEADFDDEDIASWIKELGHETESGESRSANDEELDADEIPSILTELDDQLGSKDSQEISPPPSIHLEPVDDPVAEQPLEDDTFTMSLDLARAYLEIGEQEGAKDMLKQALAGTRNPEHRQQIQELLEQID